MFQPMVASDLAKKALGPKSVWTPVIEDALKTCSDHGKLRIFKLFADL